MSYRNTILNAVASIFRPRPVPKQEPVTKPWPVPGHVKVPPDVPAARPPKRVTWMYQLQNVRAQVLAACPSTYKVIDARIPDGSRPWKRSEVEQMRGPARSKMLAYLSIGEAEDYRPYWNATANKPWLEKENPDWPGNYKVKFWHPEWQQIVFAQLNDILDAGFDGVYLDIVDAYEYFNRPEEMIAFVTQIANRCRKHQRGFLVFPQNADGLLDDPLYLQVIDGIGREDWLYGEEEDGKKNDIAGVTASRIRMAKLLAAGKPVLSVEYLAPNRQTETVLARRAHEDVGFSLLIVPRRELDVPVCPT